MLGTRFGGTEIVRVPIDEAFAESKLLDTELYQLAEVFFGWSAD